jgi:transcriptional regulator with XRE-family HTH domain
MATFHDAATTLQTARTRAGLSQRALARKAQTAQSVVARIELGEASPSWETLTRLLKAAGFALSAAIRRTHVDRQALDDVPRILALSPEDRLREIAQMSRFLAEVRRV